MRIVILGLIAAAAAYAQRAELGPYPIVTEPQPSYTPLFTQPLVSGNWFDTSNRGAVVDAYNNTYVPTQDLPMSWTGAVSGCAAGDIASTWRDAVQRRINYFRGMAGVPMGITFDAAFNGKNQKAALIMSANKALSHTPPSNWACLSAEGTEAAGKSNICLLYGYGTKDPGCVALYMVDSGSNNQPVGHRRWLLYPQTALMGTGDVSETSAGGYPRANAIWVVDLATYSNPRPTTREEYVAWPPPGYVPYQLIPARWSFSYPNANFSGATVQMSVNGAGLGNTILPISGGAGENTIVWEPATTFPKPASDTSYTVTLSNVVIGGVSRSFTYTVIMIDPVASQPQTVSITLQTNPAGLQVSADSVTVTSPFTYNWTPGSQHPISVPSPQTSGNSRSVFSSWNQGGSQSQTLTVPSSAAAYTANFTRQHRLTLGASTGGSASASPAAGDGFYNEGTTVQLTAAPSSGYRFTGWTGDVTGSTNPVTVAMGAPKSVTPNFAQNCSYSLSGGVTSFSAAGGSSSVTVNTAAGCNFSTTSQASWITLPGTTSGVGTGVVSYSVQANATTSARSSTITISGAALTITQAAAAVSNSPSALRFVPVSPCRVMDTRSGQGKSGSFGPPAFLAGSARDVPITQSGCNIPSTAVAYSLNLTVVPPGSLSYVSIWPTGQSQPVVSTLNSWDGRVVANAAIVPAGSGGSVRVFASNATEMILDVNGYFVPASTSGALAFYPVTPCRLADTRTGSGKSGSYGPPSLSAGVARSFSVPAGGCGVPTSAQAFSLNVTAVPKGSLGFLTAYPGGQAMPLASTLNSWNGQVVANAAIVPAGSGGALSVYASDATDVIVDVNGYFAAPGTGGLDFYALTPCRAVDTRSGQGKSGAYGPPTMTAQSTRSFNLAGAGCNVSASAKAHSVNVTVVPPASLGFLTLWQSGSTMPLASTLNAFSGQVTANAALVPAGTSTAISAYVSDTSDVIIDVNGYFQ